MPNAFATVDWLMQESLDLLVNKLAIGAHFNTEVQREFERDFAPGETVRVKFPQEYLIREGLSFNAQNLNRRTTTVTCDQIFGVHYQWDAYEKAVSLERGEAILSKEYIEPAVAQMAQEIESRCANWATLHTSNIVGDNTNATTFDACSGAARQRLVELGCPQMGKDLGIFVPPVVMRGLKGANFTNFNPSTDITKMYRTGIVGNADGFDWYESMSLYEYTVSTWAGAVTVNDTVASGDNQITLTCTTGDTFLEGTSFSIANVLPVNPRTRRAFGATARNFRITTSTTGAASAATITVSPVIYGPGSEYQNVDALPANGAALTLMPGITTPGGLTPLQGLAIGPDAFALVGVKFDQPPEGGNITISRQLRDEETGLTLALLRYFDGDERQWRTRLDTCLGFGDLYSDNNAVRMQFA